MDWCLLKEWVSTISTLLIGVGTLWIAYTGQSFRKDRQFENKFELAKEAIQIFNRVRNDIQQIRSPFGFEGELNRLKGLPDENELVKQMKKIAGQV